jgi:hypothetical protein
MCQGGQALADSLVEFLPMNGHFGWGGDTDLHPVALHGQNSDRDAVANGNRLSTFAAKNQHLNLLVKLRPTFLPEAGFRQPTAGCFCQLWLA